MLVPDGVDVGESVGQNPVEQKKLSYTYSPAGATTNARRRDAQSDASNGGA